MICCVSGLDMEAMWVLFAIMFTFVQPLHSAQKQGGCAIEYQAEVFDFNGLSWRPWNVLGLQNTPLKSVSVSLCNKTHPTLCGMASVCVIGKNNTMWSSFESTIHVQGNNSKDIQVITIVNETRSVNPSAITVEIKLACVNQVKEPELVKFVNKHLFILWETAAACPVKYLVPYKNCIINNDHMDKINLQPLRHLEYYKTTDSKGFKYYINICGGVVGGLVCGNAEDVAACEVDSANNVNILGFASKQQVKSYRDFTLEFRKTKKNSLKLELVCNSNVRTGELKFKSKTDTTHIFELETSFACVSKLKDCTAKDKDNLEYDLFRLSHLNDTYIRGKENYVLSVCRSVNHKLCPGGSAVCLLNGTSSVNLGTLREGIEVNDNEVSISSSGGDFCNVNNSRYRSVIVFKCSKTDKQPNLKSVSSDCVYTFNWYTPAGCPSASAVGSDCRVQDPVHAYDFNLKPLRNLDRDYVIINEGVKFDLNICGELSKPCNGSTNVGVCLTDLNGKQYPIGNRAVSPHYDDGRLSFVLDGKGCEHNQSSSIVYIIFLCNHDAEGFYSHPEYYGNHDNCTFFFTWRTVIACAEFTVHDCEIYNDKGQQFDLRPLSLPDYDYIFLTNGTKGYRKFIINVCRPVIFGHESRCPSQTGVCLQDMTEPNYQKSFTSIGEASGLQYDKERKVMKLEYRSGDLCRIGEDAEFHSVITFVCDINGKEGSKPTFIRESGCLYEFDWKTKLACPREDEADLHDRGCKLFNFHRDIVLDFNLFAGHENIVKSSSGEIFRFVICGSLNNVSVGVGICHVTKGGCENTGMGNTNLHHEIGKLYLNYTNGVLCAPNARKYTTIEFKCETKDEKLEMVTSSDLCAHTVIWKTNLACVVPCTTDEPRRINLSILSNYENNYKTSMNGVDYFINVCKPLVPKEGLKCYPGTAVCKAIHQSESSWSNETALGFAETRPVFLGSSVLLNYTSTIHCPNNTSLNLGSSITFFCDPAAGIGGPVLKNIHSNCLHEFFWNTSVVCEDHTVELAGIHSDKILNNRQSNTFINLKPLCSGVKYKVENYFINICNASFLCEVTKIEGRKEISYGRAEYAVFSYSANATKLFLSGEDCKDELLDKYNAVINLICIASSGNHIRILRESECRVEFEWKTSAACSHRSTINDVTEMRNVTHSHTSVAGVVLGILLAVIACLCVYFLRKTSCRNWCRRKLHRLCNRRHQGGFHYTLRNPDSVDFEVSSADSL